LRARCTDAAEDLQAKRAASLESICALIGARFAFFQTFC
jgi:hypothetical protein